MRKVPRLYTNKQENKVDSDYILALSCPLFVSLFLYGYRPLFLILVSFGTYTFVDYISIKIRKQNISSFGIYNLKHAMILVCLLPVSISYFLVFLGSFISSLFCKTVFGSYKSSIFNPAVTAFCFLAISFTNQVYFYPLPFSKIRIFSTAGLHLVKSGLFSLKEFGVPYVSIDDLLLGNYAGPLATGYLLVIFACYIFLIVRKRITWHIPVTFISTLVIFSFLFPRINTGNVSSLLYEVFFQPMVFIAVFIIADPSTSPVKDESKVFYGFSLAVLSMLFEYNSPYIMATLFAVLLLNPMSEYYDRVITPAFINFDLKKNFDTFKTRYLNNALNVLANKSRVLNLSKNDVLISNSNNNQNLDDINVNEIKQPLEFKEEKLLEKTEQAQEIDVEEKLEKPKRKSRKKKKRR